MTSTIVTNAESTGEHPVILAASKPSPTPRAEVDTTDDHHTVEQLVARVAELEAQTELSVEWGVMWTPDSLHDYSSEAAARRIHASLGVPPEALVCRHVRRGPWTPVTG